MKKILIILFALPLMFACNNTANKELEQLKEENQKLKEAAAENESTINGYFGAFNEIESNLQTIKEKEMLISKATANQTEVSTDAKDRINNDIQLIYDLLKENKRTISKLQKQLKNSNMKINEFEKMIERLSQQIVQKDAEIELLKEQLVSMNFQIQNLNSAIDTLQADNVEKDKVITKQTEDLNKAYYVIGTEKELKDNNIITKKGGVIGIGRVEELKKDFNKKYFTEIDIRNTTTINTNGRKIQIITTHPQSSYKLIGSDKKTDKIEITNPKEFWEASKYLVIMVD